MSAAPLALYDSHCHLHDARIGDEAEALLLRARAAGVEALLLAGVDPPGWAVEVALAARHPELRVSYGAHPQVVAEADEGEADALCAALARALDGELPRPAAVGEIGLDAMGDRAASLPLQEAVFRRQLALAAAHRLPVALHVLRAHGRALDVLAAAPPPAGGVLHSCSASAEDVRRYLRLGLSISFSGAVANPSARRLRAAARVVPLDRLLVETDAPDQTPFPRRPARNEPAFLVEIVDALAQIRGEPVEVVARASRDNARRLFDER